MESQRLLHAQIFADGADPRPHRAVGISVIAFSDGACVVRSHQGIGNRAAPRIAAFGSDRVDRWYLRWLSRSSAWVSEMATRAALSDSDVTTRAEKRRSNSASCSTSLLPSGTASCFMASKRR